MKNKIRVVETLADSDGYRIRLTWWNGKSTPSMNKVSFIKERLESKKEEILPILYGWAETFDWELDENGEKTTKVYDFVFDLMQKFENDQCNEEDYKNILFHIWQINYDEIQIVL